MCYADEAETAVHGCLIPAGVIWLCACVGLWPHHGVDVTPLISDMLALRAYIRYGRPLLH